MTTCPIPEYLDTLRRGDEWAIAAVLADRAVALLYLSDVAPDLTEYLGTPSAEFTIKRWVQRAPADLLELKALGDVYAGTVGVDGFEMHWKLAEWQPSDQLPEGA